MVHFVETLKSDSIRGDTKIFPFCVGTEKWSILWGHVRVIHFVGALKNGPFYGGTEKWPILWGI